MIKTLLLVAFIADILMIVPLTALCDGDPNAVEIDCGSGCGRTTCANYKQNTKGRVCPAVCRTGCDCKPNFVYDSDLKKCVHPSNCSKYSSTDNDVKSSSSSSSSSFSSSSSTSSSSSSTVSECDDENEGSDDDDSMKCKGPNEYFSCGGACDNVCSNLSKQNQTSCPIKNKVCNRKCYCDEGYARVANNTCVPFADCTPKPTCGVNEVYSGCANGGCFGPRKCADLGGPFICVDLIEGACKGGCLCKEGFYRNDKDVCVPEKECRGDCGSYEIFSNCTRGLCRNELCSQQADPTVCIDLADYNCDKGCVCQQNYLRADNGTCIPADQCPKGCGSDPNAVNTTVCGCRRTCSNYNKKGLFCPQVCVTGVCDCNPDYVHDDNLQKCVLPSECTPQCKGDEVFSSCTQAECRAVSCKDRNKPVACPRIAEGYCKKGCVCRPDYYRADNGTCVSESECDRITCPDGGAFNTCPPAECDAEYCPKDRNSPQSCRSTKNCGKPRCTCGFNQKRNRKTNKCIATRDCPPFKCGGPNEEYQSCPPVCPGLNCSDYINNSTCPKFNKMVVSCKPQCRCKKNYYRNSEGICVKGSQCIKEAQFNPEPMTKKPEPVTGKPDPTDNNKNALKRFSDGVYNFTFSFLNELMKSNKDKSVAASPFSVTVPLAQLALRTKGSSNVELLRVLNIRKDDIPQVFREEQDSFKNLTNVVYNLAAAVFVNNKYLLNDDFVKDSKDIFEALVESVDFSKSIEAAATINEYVEQSTNNRIKDLVTPDMLTSLTRIVLINAIYFKGLWKSQFNRNNTQDRDFYVNKDKTIQVPTMYLENKFRYINSPDADAQILEMQYKNVDFTCLFILPNSKYEDLAVTISKLTPDNMNKAINNMRTEKVKVYLPKFKIETSTDLKEILQKLGVTGIFNENKSEIVDVLKEYEPLFVSAAKQKCFVEMNEEGSEAAAANVFVGAKAAAISADPPREINFIADHPFLFFIKYKDNTLFCGTYRKL